MIRCGLTHAVVKSSLGSVCAQVLGVFREAFLGVGVVGAPLVRGSIIASLDALPRCAGASPSPDIGVGRWVGLVLLSYWGEGQFVYHGVVVAILNGLIVAVLTSGKVSSLCNIVPRDW